MNLLPSTTGNEFRTATLDSDKGPSPARKLHGRAATGAARCWALILAAVARPRPTIPPQGVAAGPENRRRLTRFMRLVTG